MQTILVIDDNAGVCQALEVLFSLYDLRTLTANSPEQGLALLREEPVDLVIQDMNFSADRKRRDAVGAGAGTAPSLRRPGRKARRCSRQSGATIRTCRLSCLPRGPTWNRQWSW
mgnify:CR=1 FL=1